MKVEFRLTQVAKGRGGDKYEATIPREGRPFVVYFPQCISRPEGPVLKEITIYVHEADIEAVKGEAQGSR